MISFSTSECDVICVFVEAFFINVRSVLVGISHHSCACISEERNHKNLENNYQGLPSRLTCVHRGTSSCILFLSFNKCFYIWHREGSVMPPNYREGSVMPPNHREGSVITPTHREGSVIPPTIVKQQQQLLLSVGVSIYR